jgi:hypothetical protein
MAAGHGGQILLSSMAAELLAGRLPTGVELRDVGEHRLKDLGRPEHLFQVVHPDLPADFPPLATLARRPNNLPTQASAFVGRDTETAAIRGLLDDRSVRLLTLIGPAAPATPGCPARVRADGGLHRRVFFVDPAPMRDKCDAGGDRLLSDWSSRARGRCSKT